jgi:pyruvate dehydrogenase E2 component (dihydrolipoamide acetyltransferase)
MPIYILMPALSPTMEKGNLARWLKKEGDKIKSGDILAEIETDKATMEVEAVDEGVLAKIVVPDGTSDVPVNDIIGMITAEGEDASSVQTPTAAKSTASPASASAASSASSSNASGSNAHASASAQASGTHAAAASASNGERIFASPLAKRIAKEGGLDLASLTGSGPHGRIVERDVKTALAEGPKPAPAPVPSSSGPVVHSPAVVSSLSDEAVKAYFEPGAYDEIPHDTMRKTIARRLAEAKATIPHFYLTVDCEIDALLKLREDVNRGASLNRDGKPSYKISVNDMVIKAMALAIVRVPGANVSFTEAGMLHHHHAHIAVAVAIPDGLITPVIRDADLLPLSVLSNQMKDMVARAKDRRLKPHEYQGGVTAISNLGMYGIKDFCAVINPPQSSILAIGMNEERAIVKHGAIVIANMMSVTISCDHRAMDGAKGAELISAFKKLIENPISMLV